LTLVLFTAFGAAGALAASQAKIIANDAEESDYFGSVSISGDYAIVGAWGEGTGGTWAGAAYIYHRTALNTWDTGTKIMADNAGERDYFGSSVSISGDYAIVGAYSEDTGGSDAGAAYIFYRDGATWSQQAKIWAGYPDDIDWFGYSVSISGDYAIAGAPLEDTVGSEDGAAYIFHRDNGVEWRQATQIVADDAEARDNFGISVSISGDYAIVGASAEDTGGSDAGAAYIFHRDGEWWPQQAKIMAPDAQASDYFGIPVSISGDYAIVGSKGEDTGGSAAGAAYIFHRSGENTWDTGTKVMASDAAADDNFGRSVSISGPYAIVGADKEDTRGLDAGAAYLYSRTGENTWDTGTKIMADDAAADDNFGSSVSIFGYYAIVGANHEDEGGLDAGAAYIIDHDLPAAIDLLSFEAEWVDGGAALYWLTGSETDCGAFTILRCEIDSTSNCYMDDYLDLGEVIPCEDSLDGAQYGIIDQTADPSVNYSYMLREYETTGGINHYGPAFLYSDEYEDDDQNDDDLPNDDLSDDDNPGDASLGDSADGVNDSDESEGGCGC